MAEESKEERRITQGNAMKRYIRANENKERRRRRVKERKIKGARESDKKREERRQKWMQGQDD